MFYGCIIKNEKYFRPEKGYRAYPTCKENNYEISNRTTSSDLRVLVSRHLSDRLFLKVDANLTLVCWARIDNKEDLDAQLKIPKSVSISFTPADYIIAAYKEWGKDCVKKLLGDWSFALWNEYNQELFLARDHCGHSSMYYYDNKNIFIFSSSLKEILKHPDVPKVLNPNAIIQLSHGYKADAQTFYRDVYRLTSGHSLVLKKNSVQVKMYWSPGNFLPVRYSKKEDYIAHFLELYQEAVRCRIDKNKTGISLSGGLDSASTAVLAAPYFLEESRKLEAFTWTSSQVDPLMEALYGPRKIFNELPFVKEIANKFSCLNVHEVSSNTGNVLSTIRTNLEIFDQPSLPLIHETEIYEKAQREGVRNLFTGHWGNHTISFAGNRELFIHEILRKNPQKIFSSFYKWKKNYGLSWAGTLKLFLEAFNYSNIRKLHHENPSKDYLHKEHVKEGILNYQGVSGEIEALRIKSIYPLNNLYNMYQSSSPGSLSTLARYYGMEVSTPAIDKRLIEYTLGIPNDQFISTEGNRLLIKRAMQGKIPEKILFSKNRGMQASNMLTKAQNEIKEMQRILSDFRKNPLAEYWLNLDYLDQQAKNIEFSYQNKETLLSDINSVQMAISLGLFLQRFDG